MVRTRSRPCGLCYHPYTLAQIKGFESPYFACLCSFASMLYARVSLSCSRLCHAWRPWRVCGCVVTPDAYEASFGCNHLGYISGCRVALCVPFPASCDDMLTMLVCATRWLSMHLYTLTYMFMQESCLLVCHPCFNTIKLWTFDPNLHLSLTDTAFCVLSCLFALFFVCLLSRMLCLLCLSCLFVSCPFHMLFAHFPFIACLPVSCFCLYMYAYGVGTLGARAWSPKRKEKGCRCEHVDMSWATVASRFMGLVFPIWLCIPLNPSLPPPFLS